MGCVPCDVCFVLWREMVRRRAGSRRRWQPAPGSVWSNPVGARPPEARGAPRLGAAVCIVAHQRRRAHVTPQRQRCSVSRPPDQPCSLHPRPALILGLSWRKLWPWPPSPRRVPRALPVHHRTFGCFGGPRTCNRCQKGGLSRGNCPNCTPGNLPARPHPPGTLSSQRVRPPAGRGQSPAAGPSSARRVGARPGPGCSQIETHRPPGNRQTKTASGVGVRGDRRRGGGGRRGPWGPTYTRRWPRLQVEQVTEGPAGETGERAGERRDVAGGQERQSRGRAAGTGRWL